MLTSFLKLALWAPIVRAAYEITYESDDDLTSFVTRPDIKIPILDVSIHDNEAAMPGLWFLSPYTFVLQQEHPKHVYQPCQIGPTIYDARGDLVWAGACDVRNFNTHDFRPVRVNNTDHLSLILLNFSSKNDSKGHGAIMNSSYDVVSTVHPRVGTRALNMHELRFTEEGDQLHAIHIGSQQFMTDLRSVKNFTHDEGWLMDTGIREVDLSTGKTVFEWWPSHHLDPAEGVHRQGLENANLPHKAWNWFHANSVEKSPDGDYMLSSRYTSTIYKISGADGSVLWRLGGGRSDFQLDGFNFSYQHDARWLSCNDDEEVITFLDNGAEDQGDKTTNTSSALIVALDKKATPPSARVLKRYWRPDGKLSELRGNFQTFTHSKNVVVGWSDNAYMTEHDESGRLLAETRFRSKRMVTYRSYKGNFTATPSKPPDVAASTLGISPEHCVTVIYASWNGATELASWTFYSSTSADGDNLTFLGSLPKTGFETMFQIGESVRFVIAEGLDKDGQVLANGRSSAVEVQSKIGLGQAVRTPKPHKDEL